MSGHEERFINILAGDKDAGCELFPAGEDHSCAFGCYAGLCALGNVNRYIPFTYGRYGTF